MVEFPNKSDSTKSVYGQIGHPGPARSPCTTVEILHLRKRLSLTHSPAGPLPHLALGGVDVAVGAADRPVPRPRPLGAPLGAFVPAGRLLHAGAVVREGYSVPAK